MNKVRTLKKVLLSSLLAAATSFGTQAYASGGANDYFYGDNLEVMSVYQFCREKGYTYGNTYGVHKATYRPAWAFNYQSGKWFWDNGPNVYVADYVECVKVDGY